MAALLLFSFNLHVFFIYLNLKNFLLLSSDLRTYINRIQIFIFYSPSERSALALPYSPLHDSHCGCGDVQSQKMWSLGPLAFLSQSTGKSHTDLWPSASSCNDRWTFFWGEVHWNKIIKKWINILFCLFYLCGRLKTLPDKTYLKNNFQIGLKQNN